MSDISVISNDRILGRSPGLGMEPKSILIGDRLRHTVHNGALKLPTRALQLMQQISVPLEGTDHVVVLPSVDSVIRPTLDKAPIVVTFLREETTFLPPTSDEVVGQESDVVSLPVATTRTVAVNQTWNPTTPDADRIRGGGVVDEEMPDVGSAKTPVVSSTTVEPKLDTAVQPSPSTALLSTDLTLAASAAPVAIPAPPPASADLAVGKDLVAGDQLSLDSIPLSAPRSSTESNLIPAVAPVAISAPTLEPTDAASAGSIDPVTAKEGNLDSAPQPSVPVALLPTNATLKPETSATPAAITAQPLLNADQASTPVGESSSVPTLLVSKRETEVQNVTSRPAVATSHAASPESETKPQAAPATHDIQPQPRKAAPSDAASQPGPTNSEIKAQRATTSLAVNASQVAPTQVKSSPMQSLPATSTSAFTPSPPSVVALAKVPPPQYAQHIPGPNDEMQVEIKNARAPWYRKDQVSEVERSLLPEWFDSSAQHRTSDSYVKAREQILNMSLQLGNRFITNALIRRTVPGDAGSLNRLFHFLMSYGFINADAINDSTPTTAVLRDTLKRSLPTKFEDALADVILKKHKANPSGAIDWQGVADEIGDGATAVDCQKGFLSLDLNLVLPTDSTERSITPDPSDKPDPKPGRRLGGWSIGSILANTDDKVLIPTIETALEQTRDLVQARNAVITSLIASQAALKAVAEEDALGQVLAELTEKRMQRLEKRIELLNDVEGMMEAERMALELERRDLYTARCRHWFGGGSS